MSLEEPSLQFGVFKTDADEDPSILNIFERVFVVIK